MGSSRKMPRVGSIGDSFSVCASLPCVYLITYLEIVTRRAIPSEILAAWAQGDLIMNTKLAGKRKRHVLSSGEESNDESVVVTTPKGKGKEREKEHRPPPRKRITRRQGMPISLNTHFEVY